MADDGLRVRLISAAEDFPVRGWPPDLHRRVIRRQRRVRAMTVAACAAVVAGAVAAIPLVTRDVGLDHDPVPAATTTTPAALVGSAWLLTTVEEGSVTITVPASIGARMELLPHGQILIDNGVNALSGRFTPLADGFEVSGVGTTYTLYTGNDPAQLAAIAAFSALAYGDPHATASSAPAQDIVLKLDATTLVVQAGALRLTFAFAGAARTFLSPPAAPR
jgi:hypothetical protein